MPSQHTGPQQQRGVISILAVFALGVSLFVAAVALDLGRAYWVKRDLQKVADLASLSAVTDLAQATTVAQNIGLANGFDYQQVDAGNSMTVTTGVYDWTNRTFSEGGAPDALNSVQVTVETNVHQYFIPGDTRVRASAISARDAIAGFSLGSYIARLNSADSVLLNSVLGGLLGGSINLDVGSYQGLAAGTISLAGLQVALGLGTVDQVLNSNVTLPALLDATIVALNNKGDTASLDAASALGPIQSAASPALSVTLGDLLKVDTSNPSAAASTEINVMQLLQTAAQAANNQHFLDIPNLGISIPGVLTVNLALSLIEPPSIAIGPAKRDYTGEWMTRAHAAQLRLRLNLVLLEMLGGGVINLPVYIEAGAGNAALTDIQCRNPIDDSQVTIETQPQLLKAYIGEVSDSVMQNQSVPVTPTTATLVNVLGLITLKGYASVSLGGGATRNLYFNGPFDQNNNKSTAALGVGSALNNELPKTGTLELKVLILTITLDEVIDALGAVLAAVDSLLDPLLSFLGVQLGGNDVTVFYLNCGVPQLVR